MKTKRRLRRPDGLTVCCWSILSALFLYIWQGSAIERLRKALQELRLESCAFQAKSRAKFPLRSTLAQEVLGFSIAPPSAEGEGARNDGCGACSVHARIGPPWYTRGLSDVCVVVELALGVAVLLRLKGSAI